MKVKTLKRLTALLIAVVMLSTCAFAAGLSNATYNKEDNTINFTYEPGNAEKVTYLAYAATDADGDGTLEKTDVIVAIDQIDNVPAEVADQNVSVKIDTAKLANVDTDNDGTAETPIAGFVLMSGDDVSASAASVDVKIPTDTFTVTFDVEGNTELVAAQNIKKGQTATEPTAPEAAEGKKFDGWYTDNTYAEDKKFVFTTEINANITLYGRFVDDTATPPAKTYTVTYELYSGVAGGEYAVTFDENSTINTFFAGITQPTIADLVEYKCTFAGWYTDAAFANAVDVNSTEKMTTLLASSEATGIMLYAKFTADIMVGDINLDGAVDANDGAYLATYAALPSMPMFNTQRAEIAANALAAHNFTIMARESYELADGSGKMLIIGDVDLSEAVDTNDGAYLATYAALPSMPMFNTQRAEIAANALAAHNFTIRAREIVKIIKK